MFNKAVLNKVLISDGVAESGVRRKPFDGLLSLTGSDRVRIRNCAWS